MRKIDPAHLESYKIAIRCHMFTLRFLYAHLKLALCVHLWRPVFFMIGVSDLIDVSYRIYVSDLIDVSDI